MGDSPGLLALFCRCVDGSLSENSVCVTIAQVSQDRSRGQRRQQPGRACLTTCEASLGKPRNTVRGLFKGPSSYSYMSEGNKPAEFEL